MRHPKFFELRNAWTDAEFLIRDLRFEIRDLRAPRAAVSLRRDSVFGANESFPRRGITNLLPGAATRFARLPRAMFLLRFQRVFYPEENKTAESRFGL